LRSITVGKGTAIDVARGKQQRYDIRVHDMFFISISGGWISSVSDENQYLQVDFLTIMEIKTLHMEGNPDLNAFVEKFMLAQSEDGISWTTLKNTLGNDKVSFCKVHIPADYIFILRTLIHFYHILQP
jgi:hypothetical protein